MRHKSVSAIGLLLGTLALLSETSADINIEAIHDDFGEVTPSDILKFTVKLKQVEGAKLDAKNLKLRLALPWFITFSGVLSEGGEISSADKQQGNVEFTLPDLNAADEPLSLVISMARNTTVDLDSGFHSIVTPMQLKFNTVKQDGSLGPIEKKEVTYSMPFVVPGCASALGMTSGNIKFYQVEASSAVPELRPDKARLGQDAWCAQEDAENSNQWIQIALKYESRISAVETYARKEKESWVTKYSVQYSVDAKSWSDYTENGFEKTFEGNVRAESFAARDNGKKHWLLNPFIANYIRIRPLAWEIALCMRLELYGCPLSSNENCIAPLGLEEGPDGTARIPDESLSDNVADPTSKPVNVRLNKDVSGFPFGWMASTGKAEPEWLQVDLGSMHKIDKVAIQGSFGDTAMFFVKKFKVQYSNNSVQWNWVQEDGQPKLFSGPVDSYDAVAPKLLHIPEEIQTRYVRIFPEEFVGMGVMRLELYGCVVEDELKKQDESQVKFARRTALLVSSSHEMYTCMYRQDRRKASCLMTADGKKWKVLDTNIVSVVAYGKRSKNIYAVDRALSMLKSSDKGTTWTTISKEEWERVKGIDALQLAKDIPNILPGEVPSQDLMFTDGDANTWGVSGAGIHMKTKDAEDWTTAAKWKCCGQ